MHVGVAHDNVLQELWSVAMGDNDPRPNTIPWDR